MKNLFLILTLFALVSCTNSEKNSGEQTSEAAVETEPEEPKLPVEMTQRDWLLISYEEGGKDFNVQGGVEITLKLTNDRCFGIGGCNNYSSSYELTGGNGMKFGEIAATKKICNSVMTQEMKYLELLKATTMFEYKDAILILSSPNGKLTYRYKPTATGQN